MGMNFPHVSLLRSGMPLYLCTFLTLTLDCWFVVLECRCYICTFELFLLVAHICVFTFVWMCVCLVYPMCTVFVYPELTSFLSVSLSLTLSLFWTPFPCVILSPSAVWYCGCLRLGVGALSSSMHCILPSHTSIHSSTGRRYSIMCPLSNDSVLSAGFQIDTPDNLGRTCLHAAAAGGWVSRSCRSGFFLLDGMNNMCWCLLTFQKCISESIKSNKNT